MQTGRYYVVDQIEQAFYDLMKEKDYTNITVTDIIKRAQVSRASFYRHFNSIGEILEYSLRKLFDRVSDEVIPLLVSSNEKEIREFLFAYTYQNMAMHEMLAACLPSNTAVILSRSMTYMQYNGSLTKDMSPEEKYRLYARSGVINSILMKWLADGKEESVEEIVNQILRFIMLF